MASTSTPVFIYINGYPGVGKLSIARALRAPPPKAKLFGNHGLIDATSMIFERDMPEYRSLRQQTLASPASTLVLNSIATSESTGDVTGIFADQRSSSEDGASAAKDYSAAAAVRGSPSVSIVLQCGLEENLRRSTGSSRGVTDTKLTDVDVLCRIRETEDVYRFGGELELEIDVTDKPVGQVVEDIGAFLNAKGYGRRASDK